MEPARHHPRATPAHQRALLLRGGAVLDGRGGPAVAADVLIEGETILAVGRELGAPPEAEVRDVTGRWILPGFVDVHAHDDAALYRSGGVLPKVGQGVTTTVVGNCGHGCAPVVPGSLAQYSLPILGAPPGDRVWATHADYVRDLRHDQLPINAAALVPHGTVRAAVLRSETRAAEPPELDAVVGHVEDSLSAGAVGLSLGLMYAPGSAATRAELLALSRVVSRHDALLVAHVRDEGARLLRSVDEMADLARASGVRLHLSHLKVTGPAMAGRMGEVIDRLDAFREEGIDVTADVYPYAAGSTAAVTLFPPDIAAGGPQAVIEALSIPARRRDVAVRAREPWPTGENPLLAAGPDGVLLADFRHRHNAVLEGRPLAEAARIRNADPIDTLMELFEEEHGRLTAVVFHTDEAGIRTALAWPWTLVGSDGLPQETGYVHPRLYGTFPRLITRYAGSSGVLSIPEAIRRCTNDASERFRLARRGLVAPGYIADLQVLDPRTYTDTATFEDPRRHPPGLETVLVRGTAHREPRD